MSSRPIRVPGPDHPITITRTLGRVTVTVAGRQIADTGEALTLRAAGYPPVYYIPAGGERSVNAVWTYEAPYAAVSEIREYLAFYGNRVDAIVITE
jgi:uncharacterized protein (DUF427 family)